VARLGQQRPEGFHQRLERVGRDVQVTLGSRQAERAQSMAEEVVDAWPTLGLSIIAA